jgi:hypothetical protein
MARPDILRGTYVNILMGDGAEPEVFTPLCGINARDLTDQVNTTDAFVRDCAIPDDVPTRSVIGTGRQWDLTGSGWMNRAQLADIEAAVGVVSGWRFELTEPASDKVYAGYWAGDGMLTQLKVTGEDGDFAKIDITIASDGPWEFTVVP